MGLISMGVGMAISSARYKRRQKRRQREAEARRSQAGNVGAALMALCAKGAYKGFHKLADAGDALKPTNEQISRELTKTHASTWATTGFFGTAFYHAGTRPVSSANPSLYEIVTVVAITVLGYLVGWLIGKWAGTSNEDDSVCETEMLLLAGDDQEQQDDTCTAQTISQPTSTEADCAVVAEGDCVTYLKTLDGKVVRQITQDTVDTDREAM